MRPLEPTWETQARSLRIGHNRKVLCCSSDPSASVSNGHIGISLYCHRCGRKEFIPHGPRSIAEVLATRVATDEIRNQRTIKMPPNAVPVSEGPCEAWQWVLRGGLSPEDATSLYGMRWHEATRRVILPIYGADGALTALCGRAVFNERPKYLMLSGRSDALFRSPVKPVRVRAVVEDVLSAIAVGRAGVNAVAVLGTAVTAEHADSIAAGADVVLGWFDSDAAGTKAWLRLRKRLALYPVQLVRITTPEDPKALHRQAIRGLVQQHIGA